jgi:hypothetical protein
VPAVVFLGALVAIGGVAPLRVQARSAQDY